MCYVVRHHHSAAVESGAPASETQEQPTGMRPRWAGAAVAAALIGGVALAASYVSPSAERSPAAERTAAPAAPVAAAGTQEIIRTSTSGGGTSLPADDGVPTSPDVARAAAGPCEHGM